MFRVTCLVSYEEGGSCGHLYRVDATRRRFACREEAERYARAICPARCPLIEPASPPAWNPGTVAREGA